MVELLKHFGDDNMVVDCARVSYGKECSNYTEEQNEKLINYLVKHNHIAPLFHPKLQFRITCPIYVERQLLKTNIGVDVNRFSVDFNSISGRYVDFSDSYTQIETWRKQSKSSKQGSDEPMEDYHQETFSDLELSVINYCKNIYNRMVNAGISKEQARTILPLNLNTTFIWTGSLYALIRLCELRLKPDAQYETGIIVRQMLDMVKNIEGNPFKHTIKAFNL
jgi:thymidylate synthase (FAD)